ncbi:hypothetical protein APX81_07740 [Escherichia coli]|uniref:hypothetical protein n=1 Tax=Escherichia coli TaxID=562 RepID=UPI000BAF998B|nr:hypothetical protein [Escherichia coli]PAZ22595.1 hypothetical protein APU33_27590 [Escherichia coli]PAZ31876.1 hypothetical protein APU34_04705 [Escherichia coli]PAZ35609.1 hypothetical protein APU35_16655 [Escherichia coli]PAZ36217.1 hypothetical protein APU36_22110 [Escherichia coli]PAZ46763.1 hypothetical protein APX81_07740 [Escherichia coli]
MRELNFPLQIFVDNDTAMMVQSFVDSGVSIDFDKLLKLMAENSEAIEDFIQGVETGDPRFMFPVTDSSMKRLVIEQTNKYDISPEQFLKGAVTILYADNILVADSMRVH